MDLLEKDVGRHNPGLLAQHSQEVMVKHCVRFTIALFLPQQGFDEWAIIVGVHKDVWLICLFVLDTKKPGEGFNCFEILFV